MALNISRKGKVFLKKEAAFGAEEALVAANYLRHVQVDFDYDQFQRVTSTEKQVVPGPVNRFDRRETGQLNTLEALLRPSGTLNTVGECDPVLEVAFGSKTNVALSTTVASGGTTTGATLTSAAGLAVGDAVLISRNAVKYVRILQTVAGAVVTWAPALPTAVTLGEAVKGCLTYKLSTDLALSLTIAHYLSGFRRELLGAAVDSLKLDFDGTEEARFTASGPAKRQLTGNTTPAAQAEPGAATSVGSNPPTGMVGDLYIADTSYLHKKLGVDLKNGLKVRNDEAGVSAASEVFRSGRRETSVSLEAFAETQATLYDLALAGTVASLFRQNGRTEGNILALYAPKVEWKVPKTSDGEDAANWAFKGLALATAEGKNDEVTIAFA